MENENQYGPQPQQSLFTPQPSLPNATAVLVLGILSLVLCICYGFLGLICGIIALVLANKDLGLYNTNPGFYSTSSYNNLKAGRVCAIIGVCLSSLWFLWIIYYLIFVGTAILSHPWNYSY